MDENMGISDPELEQHVKSLIANEVARQLDERFAAWLADSAEVIARLVAKQVKIKSGVGSRDSVRIPTDSRGLPV